MINGYSDKPVKWFPPHPSICKKNGWTHQIELLLDTGDITFYKATISPDKEYDPGVFGLDGFIANMEWKLENGYMDGGFVKIVSIIELPW